jgi:hypothetical protein
VRTVQRWAAGGLHYPPEGVLHRLLEHMSERGTEIEKTREEIAARLERPTK